jgi:hypothetical protein
MGQNKPPNWTTSECQNHRGASVKIAQSRCSTGAHNHTMRNKEPAPRSATSIRCHICGAARGEKCELNSGQPRPESHYDRRPQTEEPIPMNAGLFFLPKECPVCGSKTLQEWRCLTTGIDGSTEAGSVSRSYRCAEGHVFASAKNSPAA